MPLGSRSKFSAHQCGITAAEIAATAGKHVRLDDGYLICCPSPHHDDRTPSCKVWDGKNGPQFHCFAQCDWRDVRAGAAAMGWIAPFASQWDTDAGVIGQRDIETMRHDLGLRRTAARENERKSEAARKIWRRAGRVTDTPAGAYLRKRGVTIAVPETIRYGRVREPCSGVMLPAMVSAVCVWPSCTPCAVHVTFLDPHGCKAQVTTPKRFYGPVAGGAVRLSPFTDHLAVTEGIESGLSYQEMNGIPTWAALSAPGVKGVVLPDTLDRLTIASDNDEVGITAARARAQWAKRDGIAIVEISKPRNTGADWNDVHRVLQGARNHV